MLRVIDNGITRFLAAESVDLRAVTRADGKPVEIGIMADFLALVEISNETLAKHVAAEVNRKLLVQVDIFAVLSHALHARDIRLFRGISLGRVGSVGRPSEHG